MECGGTCLRLISVCERFSLFWAATVAHQIRTEPSRNYRCPMCEHRVDSGIKFIIVRCQRLFIRMSVSHCVSDGHTIIGVDARMS